MSREEEVVYRKILRSVKPFTCIVALHKLIQIHILHVSECIERFSGLRIKTNLEFHQNMGQLVIVFNNLLSFCCLPICKK